MSLITRCPACGTHFRVAPDQLRVSDGWVRCGQCEEVFDGQAQLQSPAAESFSDTVSAPLPAVLEETVAADSESRFNAAVPEPETVQRADAGDPSGGGGDILALADAAKKTVPEYDWGDMVPDLPAARSHQQSGNAEPPLDDVATGSEGPDSQGLVVSEVAERSDASLAASSTEPESAPLADPLLDKSPNELAAATSAAPPDDWSVSPLEELSGFDESVLPESLRYVQADGPLPEPVDAPRPTFMGGQHTSRRGWRYSRPLMGSMATLLGIGLLLQVLVQERDRLAASIPATEPVLQMLCEWVGCRVLPPRNIAAITIESSSFAKVRTDVFRLSFSLRNTGPMPLAVPAVELTLSDSQDQTLLRKVLLPEDFAGKRATLAPNGELNASLPVQVRPGSQAERVASYVVLGFYP